MWRVIINLWIERNDARWVNAFMAIMIMPHDMGQVYGLGNARHLIQFFRVSPKVWIIDNPFAIAFEMKVIDRIKTDQGWE